MNNPFRIFLGVFLAFGASWYGIVKQAYVQLADQQEVKIVGTEQRYPAPRSGLAKRGAEVYRREGCYYCHTQRVRTTGFAFNLYIEKLPEAIPATPESEAMTNAVVEAITKINVRLNKAAALQAIRKAPQQIQTGRDEEQVDAAVKLFTKAGAAKSLGIELLGTGPDIDRGWGVRQNVALDYLHDDIVMPGDVRNGPDLANVGVRKGLDKWHLTHLYSPKAMNEMSHMPSYPFLFSTRPESTHGNMHALRLGASVGPARGLALIPSEDAEALAAYLVSLKADANLFEARAPQPSVPSESTGP